MSKRTYLLNEIHSGKFENDNTRYLTNRQKYETLLKEIFQDKFDWEMFNFEDDEDIKLKMNNCLSKLNYSYQVAIELRFVYNYTYSKIAHICGMRMNNGPVIKERIGKGIKELRRNPIITTIIKNKSESIVIDNIDILDENHLGNLELTTRSFLAISRAGINNIPELMTYCLEGKLLDIRNIGKVAATEIIDKLLDHCKKINNV